MRPRVKICGITNLTDARYCSGAGVDYLGFIFCDASPRSIGIDMARDIRSWIHGPACVGVFVDEDADRVNRIVQHAGLDYVQLHGTETPAYCRTIQAPVIKALRVRKHTRGADLLERVAAYSQVADHILLDTYHPRLRGGTGTVFEWSIARDIAHLFSLFLAGGLNPSNVREAIACVHPFAVDLSSGLESAPGRKDLLLVDELFKQQSLAAE